MATSPYINSLQTGSITIASAATTGTATLGTSVGSLAFVLFQGQTASDATNGAKNHMASVSLSGSTVTATRGSSTGTVTVFYTVIDATSALVASVQSGTISTIASADTATATITSVDTTRSVVFMTGQQTSTNSSTAANWLNNIALTNSTTVTINNAGGPCTVGYTVVQFASGVVKSLQQFSQNNTTATGADTFSCTSTVAYNTWLIYQGANAAATSPYGNIMEYIVPNTGTNITSIVVTRQNTSNHQRTTNYTVLEFVAGVIAAAFNTISLGANTTTINTVSVDPTVCLVGYNGQLSSLTVYAGNDGWAGITLTNSTTITASVNATGGTPAIAYQTIAFQPLGAVSGSSAETGAASGALGGIDAGSGSAAGAGSASGSIAAVGYLSGATAGAGAASATPSGAAAAIGTASGAGTNTGTLTGTELASGSAAGLAAATGSLGGAEAAAGAAAAASSAAGTLTGTTGPSGSAAGVGVASGALSGQDAGAGSAAGSGGASGTIGGSGALTGSAAGLGAGAGFLRGSEPASGSAAGIGSATGTIGGALGLSGTAAGAGAANGTLTGSEGATGAAQGQGSTSGALTGTEGASGTAAGQAADTGIVGGKGALSGTASGAGTTQGVVAQKAGLMIGTASEVGAASGLLAPLNSATITLPGIVTFAGVVSDTTVLTEVGRQTQVFTVTIWAPTPQVRDTLASLIGPTIAATRAMPLADGSATDIVKYRGAFTDDVVQKDDLWKRTLRYETEYPTTLTQSVPAALFYGMNVLLSQGAGISVGTGQPLNDMLVDNNGNLIASEGGFASSQDTLTTQGVGPYYDQNGNLVTNAPAFVTSP